MFAETETIIDATEIPSTDHQTPPAATARPKRFHVLTWGCQMNVDDSDQIKNLLEADGLVEADSAEDADVIMLNTCSVRQKPEDKVFSKLGELAELKRANPNLTIGVTGCMAQRAGKEIAMRAPHIDLIAGTAQLERIPELVRTAPEQPGCRDFAPGQAVRSADPAPAAAQKDRVATVPARTQARLTGKLKSFVSIMYGCDKFCAFCIVPLTRGKERSRPADEIVAEVEHLAAHGTKEVTLLGQTVNSYGLKGLEATCSFAELLRRVNDVPGIERIRFTSPYPKDFSDDVIEAMATLPARLRAGASARSGRRRHPAPPDAPGLHARSVPEIVRKLRAAMPDIAITTDLMLGFPGETEEQFQNTCGSSRRSASTPPSCSPIRRATPRRPRNCRTRSRKRKRSAAWNC
jgi:tRNA-2-methylthio-N6-dimethylallyladenosine synthase